MNIKQIEELAGHRTVSPWIIKLVQEAIEIEVAAKQAEIDRLMLEYCPQEMTKEQLLNWSANQRAALHETLSQPEVMAVFQRMADK